MVNKRDVKAVSRNLETSGGDFTPDAPKKFLDRIKFIVPILSILNR